MPNQIRYSPNNNLIRSLIHSPVQPVSNHQATSTSHKNNWSPSSVTRRLISPEPLGNPIQSNKIHHISDQVVRGKNKGGNPTQEPTEQSSAETILLRDRRSINNLQIICYNSFQGGIVESPISRINADTKFFRYRPAITHLTSGKKIITWISKSKIKNKKHTIDGQLFSSDGTPIGREFSVNTLLVNAFPGLLPLTLPKDKIALVSRNFFGTPQSMMLTIFDTISKRVDANFSLGPFVPSKRYASCTLKNGNLLLVYQNFNQGMNVYVEMRSSQGEGLLKKKIALEGSISNQALRFLITSLSDGNVVIVYYAYNQSTGIVVKGRIFSPKLEDLMRPFVACGAHDKKSSLPLLKELENGNFIISCIQQNNDSFGIHGEVFSTRGRVKRRGFDIDTGPFTDIRYALTTTPIRNDIVVAWNKRVPDLTQSIKVRSFPSITGTKDREFSIAIESRFFGKTFEISPLKNGAFFLVWDTIDSTDIMSKKILLRDILSLLPRVQESALTAQECSSRKKNLEEMKFLNRTLEEERQKYRVQVFSEKDWRIVCFCTAPVILISMIINGALLVSIKKRRRS